MLLTTLREPFRGLRIEAKRKALGQRNTLGLNYEKLDKNNIYIKKGGDWIKYMQSRKVLLSFDLTLI